MRNKPNHFTEDYFKMEELVENITDDQHDVRIKINSKRDPALNWWYLMRIYYGRDYNKI